MFKFLFEIIDRLFPYNIKNPTNNIYIYINGKKKKLRHKIKGLKVTYRKESKNNILNLYFPLSFIDTEILFTGKDGKVTIKETKNTITKAFLDCSAYGEIFIDEDSRITRPNLNILADNNTKENPSKVVIGKSTQIGKDVIIRTSDGHSIFNIGEEAPYNTPQDVIIGDNVWLGERVIVLKGSKIPNNTIAGSYALINKKFEEENTILAGNPAKVVKRGVSWTRKPYGAYMRYLARKKMPKLKNEKRILIKKIKHKLSKFKFLSNF